MKFTQRIAGAGAALAVLGGVAFAAPAQVAAEVTGADATECNNKFTWAVHNYEQQDYKVFVEPCSFNTWSWHKTTDYLGNYSVVKKSV
ncbi:hypothetical protein [Citricoccus sp. NR2]|uniref:hypothetical protein n=1 Tax=Citricoccus sp. NR2 TaxID=3004095 RepID=UPI0022DD1862|nr:hypothetical protein [Citricoccus sp. NR2]WBL18381.1 hypothetical protein O1A05_11445 [Citricoccus sp. NR2]